MFGNGIEERRGNILYGLSPVVLTTRWVGPISLIVTSVTSGFDHTVDINCD